jgi:hypothetical protein
VLPVLPVLLPKGLVLPVFGLFVDEGVPVLPEESVPLALESVLPVLLEGDEVLEILEVDDIAPPGRVGDKPAVPPRTLPPAVPVF